MTVYCYMCIGLLKTKQRNCQLYNLLVCSFLGWHLHCEMLIYKLHLVTVNTTGLAGGGKKAATLSGLHIRILQYFEVQTFSHYISWMHFFVVVDDLHITSINDSNRNRVQYTIHRRITDRLYLLVKRKTQSSMYYNSSKSKWKPHYRERYPCGGRGTASDDLFNGYERRNKMWF